MGIFIRGKIDELSSFDIDPSRGCSREAGNAGQVDLVEEWVKKNIACDEFYSCHLSKLLARFLLSFCKKALSTHTILEIARFPGKSPWWQLSRFPTTTTTPSLLITPPMVERHHTSLNLISHETHNETFIIPSQSQLFGRIALFSLLVSI